MIPYLITPVAVSVKPLQAIAGKDHCMFLQRTDTSCSQDFAALMERAMEKLNTEQTYAVLDAPAPYAWDTENWITHDTALNMKITCIVSADFNPCGDYARCVTCQALKGNQWQKDCYPMFMEAINALKGLIPAW